VRRLGHGTEGNDRRLAGGTEVTVPDRVIVAGVGMTAFTRSGRRVRETAQEAVAAVLADAGTCAD
jgi:hypothetical protein